MLAHAGVGTLFAEPGDEGRRFFRRRKEQEREKPSEYRPGCQGGQREIQSGAVESDESAGGASQQRAQNPVALVKQGDQHMQLSPVHMFRNLFGTYDGKGLVGQAEDQVRFSAPCAAVFFQHRDAVGHSQKQVAHHDRDGFL